MNNILHSLAKMCANKYKTGYNQLRLLISIPYCNDPLNTYKAIHNEVNRREELKLSLSNQSLPVL